MLGNASVVAVVPTTDIARARDFYGGTLGLSPAQTGMPDDAVLYECGGGTRLLVYQRATAGESPATCASFEVEDFDTTAQQLRDAGVKFEDYDLPGLKTENGIATVDGFRAAWFKDPDGNILNLSTIP